MMLLRDRRHGVKSRACLSAFVLLGVSANGAYADVVYDEAVDGDLSGAFASPTVVSFGIGDNTIIGQVGENGDTGATDGSDADYFQFTIGPGQTLTSLSVDDYASSEFSGSGSFLGYSATGFTGQGGGDIDSYILFDEFAFEPLVDLAGGPLGPGTYFFWAQEINPTLIDYQLTFTVVPEPASASALLALGMLLPMRRTRRSA